MLGNNDAVVRIGGDNSGAMSAINQVMGAMPGLGAAIAGGFSIAAITAFTRAAIDAADNLNDMSQKFGISVETLAGFKLAAEQNGTTVEAMGGAIKKLSSYMVDNEQKMASLGITAKTSDGALLQLSDVFSRMTDPMQKTALATELFGKAGVDMIPMLNQGSAALGELIAKGQQLNPITTDMAKNADAFNDQMLELKLSVTAAGTSLVADMLPALNAVIGRLAEGMQKAGGFAGAIKEVMASGLSESQLRSAIAQIDARGETETLGDADRQDRARYERELNRIREQKSAEIVAGYGPIDSREGKAYADSQGRAANAAAGKITGKPGKKSAIHKVAKEDIAGPEISNAELVKRAKDDMFEGPQISDWDLQIATAAAKEQEKQQRITDAYMEGQAARWEQMEIDNLSKDELELSRYEAKLAELDVLRGNELLTEQQHQNALNAVRFNAAMKSSSQIMQIKAAADGWEKFSTKEKTQFGLNMAEQLTAGLAGQSRKMFEAHKAASVGQALMNTYEGATTALAQGGLWGALMMAVVLATGMAQVSKIRSQTYGGGGGGGGGVSSFPTADSISSSTVFAQNSSGTAPGPAQPVAVRGQAETARTQVNVTLVGSVFDYNTVATELIPLLNDAAANGADIRVTQGQ